MTSFKEALAARFNAAESNVVQPVPEPPRPAFTPQSAETEVAAYLAEVERVYQLARAGRDVPATVKIMGRLESASPDEQLEQIAQLVNVPQPAPVEVEPEPEQQVPDVDPNNPMAPPPESFGFRLPDGTPLTDAYVQRFLSSLGPGTYADWKRQADSA